MEVNNAGVRSGRDYPSLNQVSVAPLTSRFPIDDDPEPTDYFSPRGDANGTASGAGTPPTSYLSSVSVPGTPSVLSHSRNPSHSQHARSRSFTRVTPLSDTNLHSHAVAHPLHHQCQKRPPPIHARRQGGQSGSDAEWVLRAGIALASTTREEKGQSWLSKRESSTSLVSETHFDEASANNNHNRRTTTKSGASSRKSRSGTSTPAAHSRRSSRRSSRGGSIGSSRAGLTMTGVPPLSSNKTPGSSPEEARGAALVADFVDERIRAEMASLQQQEQAVFDEFEYWDGDEDEDSEYEYFSDQPPDDIDEADLQRLTRERGFGLGSWIDRLVEWTLFSTEEWPALASSTDTRIGSAVTTTTVTFEEPVTTRESEEDNTLPVSVEEDHDDQIDDADMLSHADSESMVSVEGPGDQGGWEDAGWLFRVMKRAITL